jgi:Aspartyl protease
MASYWSIQGGVEMKMLSRAILVLATSIASDISAAADASTTVAIQMRGNFPVIVATIDGNSVPLILDFGDESALVLSKNVMDRVKIAPSGETQRLKDAAGNIIRSGTFRLPKLRIGNAVFANVLGRPDFHDPSYQSTDVGQQGYLGTALLKSYRVVLDFPHQQMTLIPKNSNDDRAAMCMGTKVPLLATLKGALVSTAVTDFGELTVVWDTASPVSVLHKDKAPKITEDSLEATSTSRFILGGTNFGPLNLAVADYAEPAGSGAIIGYNFFAQHIVCVDFPGKRFGIR